MYDDRGFYKRAQIVPTTSRSPASRRFGDLDRLTIFADNLVPHVLRCDGVLVYDAAPGRAHRRRRLLRPGPQEREIRACAVHACELSAARLGVTERDARPLAVEARAGRALQGASRGTAAGRSSTDRSRDSTRG